MQVQRAPEIRQPQRVVPHVQSDGPGQGVEAVGGASGQRVAWMHVQVASASKATQAQAKCGAPG